MLVVRRALTAAAVALAVWTFALAAPWAAPTLETIEIPGSALLHYDPARISESRLLELALLSPHVLWAFLPDPCVADDPESGCGPETVAAPDLFAAENDLFEVEEMLADVQRLRVPPQLDAVRDYVRRHASFQVCLRRAELAYYRGDDGALAAECEDIAALASCPAIVADSVHAPTPAAKHRLAAQAWRDCMTAQFGERYGEYPAADWQQFLDAHGIEEELMHGC